MGNAVTLEARSVVASAAERIGADAEMIRALFAGAPLDFPVSVATRLPLFAHRFGMIGITLFGRVHLLERALRLPPADLIILLRHEAEHVRQQRSDPLFYLRYGAGWIAGAMRESLAPGSSAAPDRRMSLFARAYRGIRAEREAYAADAEARELLRRIGRL